MRPDVDVEDCDWSAQNIVSGSAIGGEDMLLKNCQIGPLTLENSETAFPSRGSVVGKPVWSIHSSSTMTDSVVRQTPSVSSQHLGLRFNIWSKNICCSLSMSSNSKTLTPSQLSVFTV